MFLFKAKRFPSPSIFFRFSMFVGRRRVFPTQSATLPPCLSNQGLTPSLDGRGAPSMIKSRVYGGGAAGLDGPSPTWDSLTSTISRGGVGFWAATVVTAIGTLVRVVLLFFAWASLWGPPRSLLALAAALWAVLEVTFESLVLGAPSRSTTFGITHKTYPGLNGGSLRNKLGWLLARPSELLGSSSEQPRTLRGPCLWMVQESYCATDAFSTLQSPPVMDSSPSDECQCKAASYPPP